jgi:hypothetical protein
MHACDEFSALKGTRSQPILIKMLFGVVVFGLAILTTLVTERAYAQDSARVAPPEAIPRNQYKTWSLFLVCNPEWLGPEKAPDLYSLYQQFGAFGRAIGDDHLAVWFWKSRIIENDPKIADKVDVERSVRFCRKFQLQPSSSPYVFITTSYPDESRLVIPKDYAFFELAKMKSADISKLLTKLTDELVLKGRVEGAKPAPEAEGVVWIRLLEATQRAIGDFGCAWNLKVQTGLLAADLHPCRTP